MISVFALFECTNVSLFCKRAVKMVLNAACKSLVWRWYDSSSRKLKNEVILHKATEIRNFNENFTIHWGKYRMLEQYFQFDDQQFGGTEGREKAQ